MHKRTKPIQQEIRGGGGGVGGGLYYKNLGFLL
jgi:hypothetical protein